MSAPNPKGPFRLLFLCTGNSARSQMAEAILNRKGRGQWVAESAGSHPANRVNPYATATLRKHGYDWQGHQPRGLDDVENGSWDFVITVCDRAKESCPILPGQPVMAHWGMLDPAEIVGSDEIKERAFEDAFVLLNRRIDLLLALPMDKLERSALVGSVRKIGEPEAAGLTTGEGAKGP